MAYLAFWNVKKNKRYFFIVMSIILFLSVFYNTTYIYQESYKNVIKDYNSEKYGEWYVQEEFKEQDMNQQKVNKLKNIFETQYKTKKQYQDFKYCFAYKQNNKLLKNIYREDSFDFGNVAFDNIGYFENDYMNLCHVQLKEGIMPKESKDIAISTRFQKEHQLSLNDPVVIYINGQLVKCHVVGIYQNSQENMLDVCVSKKDAIFDYPILYSNSSLLYQKSDEDIRETISEIDLIETINVYGYDHNTIHYSLSLNNEQVITLFNILVVVSILLICLNKTSYRKRMKEFALYRGIGMTTFQLIFMMICEILFIVLFAIVIGVIISFIVSYALMLGVEKELGYFRYVIDIKQMIINCCTLFMVIMIVNIFPIYQSANIALSGAFGAKKFSYFEVRQKKLKPIRNLRFAFRELLGNYLVILCLVIFLSFFSSMIVVNQFGKTPTVKGDKHYILNIQTHTQIPNALLNHKYHVEKFRVVETDISTVNFPNISSIRKVIAIDNEEMFNKYLTSSVKNSKAEKLIGNEYVYLLDTLKNFPLETDNGGTNVVLNDKHKVEKNDVFSYSGDELVDIKVVEDLVSNVNSNLCLYVSSQDIEIVEYIKGFLNRNQILYNDIPIETVHYFPEDAIYLNKEEFDTYFNENIYEEAYVFFDNKAEVDNYLNIMMKYRDIEVKYINEYQIYEDAVNNLNKLFIPTSSIIAVMVATFIILMYMNISDIENHKHDYFLQRLLGMTDLDIMKKQLIKVIIVFVMMSSFSLFFTVLQSHYYMQKFQLSNFIFLLVIQFFILVIDFIIPMLIILKNKELIKIEERE